MKIHTIRLFLCLLLGTGVLLGLAQENGKPKAPAPNADKAKPGNAKAKAGKGKTKLPPLPVVPETKLDGEILAWRDETVQRDFPAIAAAKDEGVWVNYVQHDGQADVLWLARATKAGFEPVAALSEPGVIHQPAITIDAVGNVWSVWGQTGEDDIVHLLARSVNGKTGAPGEIVTLAKSAGSDSFADLKADRFGGKIWVVWQSMRAGEGDIYARWLGSETGEWAAEIAVSDEKGGDWEPRIAFGPDGDAWIVYDSSRGNEFNLYLARVTPDGKVETHEIAHTPAYEARASIAPTADGGGLWIAAERGRVRWGLDVRGHEDNKGLNAQKEILFGRFDIEKKIFQEIPLGPAGQAGYPVNLPAIGIDPDGNPWVAYRYFARALWKIAITKYDTKTDKWRARSGLPDSSMGQDRRMSFANGAGDSLWACWPSDLRQSKVCGHAGVFLARIDTAAEWKDAAPPKPPGEPKEEPYAASQDTPERPSDDHHFWEFGGKKYGLYWGDLHRHTDVSNCRTGFDGCIVEQFRYAYDMAKLDFLGTTDHTDVGKPYHPYEWWHNQRLHDVFHAPGQFNSLYAYEREQRWPWGHRNVVFAQRGGPLVYIKRALYRASQWQEPYPVQAGLGEIEPPELWKILKQYGKPVALISHTGATRMGTDWSRYDKTGIDSDIENLVEIFQGARVSYEGIGAPQPTAGLRPGEGYTADSGVKTPEPPAVIEDFGEFNAGVYQNALALGHKLGVFASSDHISQHMSYGGVYVEEFTREGIIEGFNARRTMAATDKIYVEFSCNGQPMGTEMEVDGTPKLKIFVDGTAPLKRVTLVRNEENYQVYEPGEVRVFRTDFEDPAPLPGENRYYLRVEQTDGNMAWSSPVWAKRKTEK